MSAIPTPRRSCRARRRPHKRGPTGAGRPTNSTSSSTAPAATTAKSHPSASIWSAANGANPTLISGTTGAYYPKWNLEGTLFVTENDGGTPSPCNTIFTLGGVAQTANIDGVDANNVSMFGGMPAVMSTDLPQIAYAGQPKLANWNGPNTPIQYSENYNYIFLNALTDTGFVSSPLESDASISSFDPQYEGRAPDISPDGTMIVFESNRPSGAANYSIWLYSLKNKSVTQVTVSTLNCQHAKFFPCGTKLILGAQKPTRSIAKVDISTLL